MRNTPPIEIGTKQVQKQMCWLPLVLIVVFTFVGCIALTNQWVISEISPRQFLVALLISILINAFIFGE